MKRLILLCLTLVLSLNAFSQNVTEIKDTSHIVLSTEIARKVAVDLVEGDRAKEEVKILKSENLTLKQIVALQDTLGIIKENEIADLYKLLELNSVQTKGYLEETDRLNKELGKQCKLKTMFEVTTGVATLGLIISLILGGR